MKFFILKNDDHKDKSLIYRSDEYSFDTEPHDGDGFTSILVNDLQLEIDDEGKIMYVWGLCPLTKYERTDEFPRECESSSLIALLDRPPIPGVSYRLNEKGRWPIYINKEKGWVCLGDPEIINKNLIEFASNCVAAMRDQELMAVWLHPDKLPAALD